MQILVCYILTVQGGGGSEKIPCYIPQALIYPGDQNYKIFRQHNKKHQTNKNTVLNKKKSFKIKGFPKMEGFLTLNLLFC